MYGLGTFVAMVGTLLFALIIGPPGDPGRRTPPPRTRGCDGRAGTPEIGEAILRWSPGFTIR